MPYFDKETTLVSFLFSGPWWSDVLVILGLLFIVLVILYWLIIGPWIMVHLRCQKIFNYHPFASENFIFLFVAIFSMHAGYQFGGFGGVDVFSHHPDDTYEGLGFFLFGIMLAIVFFYNKLKATNLPYALLIMGVEMVPGGIESVWLVNALNVSGQEFIATVIVSGVAWVIVWGIIRGIGLPKVNPRMHAEEKRQWERDRPEREAKAAEKMERAWASEAERKRRAESPDGM